VDVDYFRNPKTLEAGRDGRSLHLASICYSGEEESDGHISRNALRIVLAHADVPRRAVDLVVDAGLWFPVSDGFMINGYLDIQPSREERQAERDRWARNQAARRARLAALGVTDDSPESHR